MEKGLKSSITKPCFNPKPKRTMKVRNTLTNQLGSGPNQLEEFKIEIFKSRTPNIQLEAGNNLLEHWKTAQRLVPNVH